jgi:hypothetical protein
MGFVAPFIPYIISAVAGTAVSKLANKSSKASDSGGTPPVAPETPPSTQESTNAAIPASIAAALNQKKKAKGAAGRQSTILTGPSGLGDISSTNVEHKTILGY